MMVHALQQLWYMRRLAVVQRQVRALPCSHASADGRLAMVDVDQLLASEEQFLLAEAQAMERACTDAFAGQEVGAQVALGGCEGVQLRGASVISTV